MSRLILALLLLSAIPAQAQQVDIRGARIWPAPDQTRVVIDTAAEVSHKIFSLDHPPRLVIDIPDARLTGRLPTVEASDKLLAGMRSGIRAGVDLRIVLDLKGKVRVKSFLLRPNDRYGHRLVVDLSPRQAGDDPAAAARSASQHSAVAGRATLREVVVAIDAGHGGEDPGAVGAGGTREKDVTLAIARKLDRLVKLERGMRPLLVRDGDYYVSLRKRIAIARKHQADIFVSIHADAFNDPHVGGSSVYTLSYRGASSEAAKWLADKENNADLIGGIDLSDSDDELATVLLDMTQSATMEHGALAAQKVLDSLKQLGDVHKARVQKAGFVVLKAPDIPSMLVETAYISNPHEAKRLRDRTYQMHLAKAILAGIKDYFASFPPPGTVLAAAEARRRHVISRGDTLGDIAKLYDVSLSSLRSANGIDGDVIQVGQVLNIPGS